MNSSCFSDSDAWMYAHDGSIIGRARNNSWKEILRNGVSIDYIMYLNTKYDEPEVNTTIMANTNDAYVSNTSLIMNDYDEYDKYYNLSPTKRKTYKVDKAKNEKRKNEKRKNEKEKTKIRRNYNKNSCSNKIINTSTNIIYRYDTYDDLEYITDDDPEYKLIIAFGTTHCEYCYTEYYIPDTIIDGETLYEIEKYNESRCEKMKKKNIRIYNKACNYNYCQYCSSVFINMINNTISEYKSAKYLYRYLWFDWLYKYDR